MRALFLYVLFVVIGTIIAVFVGLFVERPVSSAIRLWLIPLTQVALDVVCREVGRVRSPGRTPDG